MLDTSNSMGPELFESIKEGAKEAFAAGMGDGERRDYAVINFSSRTLYSGWVPKTKSKQLEGIIDKHQQYGTEPDLDVIAQLKNKKEKFAALLVTDGTIYNNKQLVSVLKDIVSKGNKLGVVCTNTAYIDPFIKEVASFAFVYFTPNAENTKKMIKHYARCAFQGTL